MTGPQHYREAERLADRANYFTYDVECLHHLDVWFPEGDDCPECLRLLALYDEQPYDTVQPHGSREVPA